ncbi:MAG: lysophospholipid acyltransferase family protein [Angustibacter sp.]
MPSERPSVNYRAFAGVLRPALRAMADRDWRGSEHLPARGGVVVRTNHITHLDPLVVGHFLVMFPEGTLTRDPRLWPMVGKTGAARVALATGCPVVPVAHWGAQRILPRYSRTPRLWPRATIRVVAGPPVALDDLRARPVDTAVLTEATERIMAVVTTLLVQLRGEEAPPRRHDPREHGQVVVGRIPPAGRGGRVLRTRSRLTGRVRPDTCRSA